MYPFEAKFNPDDVYWTSDLHLQHKNICAGVSNWKSGTRDFANLNDMNETIIKSINDVVSSDKILIHIGDFCFGDKSLFPYWLSRINCKTIFHIYGNHDGFIRKNKDYQELFTFCGDYLEIFVENHRICNFHFPIKLCNEAHRGGWACTGHSHGNLPYADHEMGIDVGWDVWRKPLSYYEIKELMNKKTWKQIDHHNKKTF